MVSWDSVACTKIFSWYLFSLIFLWSFNLIAWQIHSIVQLANERNSDDNGQTARQNGASWWGQDQHQVARMSVRGVQAEVWSLDSRASHVAEPSASVWHPTTCVLQRKIGYARLHSILNSLWPIDAIWHQRNGSTLAPVMACCLTAPSHCLNQSSDRSNKNHLREIPQKIPQPSTTQIRLKITI